MESQDVRQRWAERSGEYSPGYYAYYGPNETSEAIGTILERTVGREGRILEVGCSSGRHLAHLDERGFEELHGVDINAAALEVMAEYFPSLAASGTFHIAGVGDALTNFEDDAFDAVFTVETLQHIHPDDAEVFDEIARVAGDVLVTVENEPDDGDPHGDDAEGAVVDVGGVTFVDDGMPLYHRDWERVFSPLGFSAVESRSMGADTLRIFRPLDD